jgi:hypothetical protein
MPLDRHPRVWVLQVWPMSADSERPEVLRGKALDSTDEEVGARTTPEAMMAALAGAKRAARRHGRRTELAALLDARLDEDDAEPSPSDRL